MLPCRIVGGTKHSRVDPKSNLYVWILYRTANLSSICQEDRSSNSIQTTWSQANFFDLICYDALTKRTLIFSIWNFAFRKGNQTIFRQGWKLEALGILLKEIWGFLLELPRYRSENLYHDRSNFYILQ